MNSFNTQLQPRDTKSTIRNKLKDSLTKLRLVTTLVLEFKTIDSDDETKWCTFYFSSKVETMINESDIDDVFGLICSTIISNIQKLLGKISGWVVDSVVDHTINISKYKRLRGSSFVKLPKELDYPKRRVWLIFKILVIMNALSCVWSDTYTLQINIQ